MLSISRLLFSLIALNDVDVSAFLQQKNHHLFPPFSSSLSSSASRFSQKYEKQHLRKATFLQQELITATTENSPSSSTSSSLPDTISTCDSFGGQIYSLKLDNKDDGFLTAMSVPTFAVRNSDICNNDNSNRSSHKNNKDNISKPSIKRLGLEGIIPGAFLLNNVFTQEQCEEMINCCEHELKFQQFKAGRNHHGAMQVVVTDKIVQKLSSSICPFVDVKVINELANEMMSATAQTSNDDLEQKSDNYDGNNYEEYAPIGLNRRWRIYKYQPGGEETFAPHIDAGFSPSVISNDGLSLIWDATSVSDVDNNGDDDELAITMPYPKDTVSRLTVLMYLNDDFEGGQTKFYSPVMGSSSVPEVMASIQPKAGSLLIFPQAVGEDAVEYARKHWPLHEGSPVTSALSPHSRGKYVIRSDILFTKVRQGISEEEKNDPLWENDDIVRETFSPSSLALSSSSNALNSLFLNHCQELYNPHMGVENAGPLLYSLVRFTKLRKIVEIGAGYTTLFLLQALKDNDNEMKRVKTLQDEGKCRLLNYPWTITDIVDQYDEEGDEASSLLCIDNCLHQRETATGAGAVAKSLGLDNYLKFVKGDAFDMQFEKESIDLLWCDFGVGSKMKEFASSAWKSIKPGGFLVCHSTLTNLRTRSWLEMIRDGTYSEEETGIPQNEFVEISFLEPHKRYQNSVTILQRRRGDKGDFKEPIYSEYA